MRPILVVDDNAAFAENMAEILEDYGAHCTVSLTRDGALEQPQDQPFDGIISDARMPGASLMEFVSAARSLGPQCPIVVVGAYREDKRRLVPPRPEPRRCCPSPSASRACSSCSALALRALPASPFSLISTTSDVSR